MKISVVSYLNSKPFIRGLETLAEEDFTYSLDIPSVCAKKLLNDEVDIGLIPVAVLRDIPNYQIISKYCIGAVGKVDSVKLYSHVPLEKITHITLDYHSRTSVALVRVLARELWKINPIWEPATEGYEQHVSGTHAAVIIGDRTFAINGTFPYEYDLAEGWEQLTGLPFVFAVWASKKPLDPTLENKFSEALEKGIAQIQNVVEENSRIYPGVDVNKYLTQSISYPLDTAKREALQLFLSKL
jgi:chorismate dehydratase